MRSAVLDTNVIISGLLRPVGAPARIMDLGFSRQFKWYTSHAILAEYEVVWPGKDSASPRAGRQISSPTCMIRLWW